MKPHQNKGIEKRFIFSIVLTALILVVEVGGGMWTHSLALLSDAAHVFTDIFALGLSFMALRLSALPADDSHTYGYHRLEVLAALVNGLSLVLIAIGIWSEAIQRFSAPQIIRSNEMLIIAVIGLVVNIVVALVLGGHDHDHSEKHAQPVRKDLNVESAFLHVLGDAISSVGVIIAAVLIARTGWQWLDPLVSILIGFIIVISAWRVLRSSLHILVEGVPEGLSSSQIKSSLLNVPAVQQVHDLHVWNICSGHIALSAHVVLQDSSQCPQIQVMTDLKDMLLGQFGIEHTTIQFEECCCGQGD